MAPAQRDSFGQIVTFGTAFQFPAVGVYEFTLQASDGSKRAEAGVTVSVYTPGNQPPILDVGTARTIAFGDDLSLNPTIRDDGLPNGRLTLQWTVRAGSSGVTLRSAGPGQGVLVSFPAAGAYTLRATASDGDASVFADLPVTVLPGTTARPTISLVSPLDGSRWGDGQPIPLIASATDPDGSIAHVDFIANGELLFRDTAELYNYVWTGVPLGDHVITAVATDNSGTQSLPATARITATNLPPTIRFAANLDGAFVATGRSVALETIPVDAEGQVARVDFLVNGTVVASRTSAPWSLALDALSPGTKTITARVLDGTNQSGATAPITLTLGEPGPSLLVDITSPADAAVVTRPTSLRGTVRSARLSHYTFRHRLVGSSTWTEAARGEVSVTNGGLATFDPTLLRNGLHELQITAHERPEYRGGSTLIAGGTTSATTTVIVDTRMKVGHFALTFEDLQMPVSGVPVQLLRSYDSRGELQGDFGLNWDLGVRAVQVYENKPLGTRWTLDTTNSGIGGRWFYRPLERIVVTVVVGDDQVEQFEAYSPVNLNNSVLLPPPTVATIAFRPINGSTGELRHPESGVNLSVIDAADGSYQFDTFSGFYDPSLYTYIAPDGTQLEIREVLGLRKVTDRNGNALTISENGISHSSGRSIAFTRDGAGRITRITDPDDFALTYEYDAQGRLTRFTDREGNNPTSPLYGTFTEYRYENPSSRSANPTPTTPSQTPRSHLIPTTHFSLLTSMTKPVTC